MLSVVSDLNHVIYSLYNKSLDLNLGCPQTSARDGHYGGYLLGQKDWPLVESLGRLHIFCSNYSVDQTFQYRQCHNPSLFPFLQNCDFVSPVRQRSD